MLSFVLCLAFFLSFFPGVLFVVCGVLCVDGVRSASKFYQAQPSTHILVCGVVWAGKRRIRTYLHPTHIGNSGDSGGVLGKLTSARAPY